jgi:hypothetical protein
MCSVPLPPRASAHGMQLASVKRMEPLAGAAEALQGWAAAGETGTCSMSSEVQRPTVQSCCRRDRESTDPLDFSKEEVTGCSCTCTEDIGVLAHCLDHAAPSLNSFQP